MIDTADILAMVDLVELVGRRVDLKRAGKEWTGLCPFHTERTPSFRVVPTKRFVHCFGCGAHYDAIGFVMAMDGVSFVEACEALAGKTLRSPERRPVVRALRAPSIGAHWIPTIPPAHAPHLEAGRRIALWNPNRQRFWTMTPTCADVYRDALGRRLGYVLRIDFEDGRKITPQVTWCVGPDGSAQWCTRPFLAPKPLCGLDALANKPDAVVLVVEGEKCRAMAADVLPMLAVVTWPGGSQAVGRADWSPLRGRDVLLWPDADEAGVGAMLGRVHHDGTNIDGIAAYAARADGKRIRYVDTQGMPRGWDIADAIEDAWTSQQLLAWADSRLREVEVEFHAAA